MLLVWSVVIAMVAAATQRGFRVNKCCSEDQALTSDFTCTDYNGYYTYSMNELPPWLPSDVTVGSESLSEFHVITQFGSQARCEGRQHLVLEDDVDLFSLLDDGGLLLYDNDYRKNKTFPASSFCFDRLLFEGSQTVKVILLCPCDTMNCIRKCCPPGKYLHENQRCMPEDTDTVQHSIFHNDYFQLNGFPRCPNGVAYLLNLVSSRSKHSQYRFSDDGRAVVSEFKQPIPVEDYCWDVTVDENGSEIKNLLYCKSRGRCSERKALYGVMVLIDAGFLSATLLVYAALPELRKGLHAKYLMAHTASFLVAYLFLGIGQIMPDLHYGLCKTIGETTGATTFLGYRVQFKSLALLRDYI
jgi:hypothetical protein